MSNREITIRDMVDVLFLNILILFMTGILAGLGSYTLYQLTYRPEYKSKATLYVMRQEESVTGFTYVDELYTQYSMAKNVLTDCREIIKSQKVLSQVIKEQNLDVSYSMLLRHVEIESPEDSRIINVYVTDESPYRAKKIADAICNAGIAEIEEVLGYRQISIYDEGSLNDYPVNQTGVGVFAAFGLAATIIVYAVLLLKYVLDGTILRAVDVKTYLGTEVLADIELSRKAGTSTGESGNAKQN